jgi:hypothetical protein
MQGEKVKIGKFEGRRQEEIEYRNPEDCLRPTPGFGELGFSQTNCGIREIVLRKS